jgi:hypothetical protein
LKTWSRTDWLIIVLFAGLVLLFYWRILTPNLADRQSFPPGDFQAQFWAFTTFEVRELGAGRLPLWNPYTFAGAPFWADVQSAVFYPPSLATILLSAPWGFSLFALEIEAIAHFWLAALFTYLFVRDITRSRVAAVVGAVTFTFSGYLTGYPSQQLAVLEADVWLPLILFFLYRASQASLDNDENELLTGRPSDSAKQRKVGPTASRYLLLAGVAWGMALLAGHPQSALIVAYVSSAYFFFLWFSKHSLRWFKLQTLTSAIAYWLLFVLTGLALAAIQFIPAAEYTRLSVRAEGTYQEMSGGLPVMDVIQLLLPGQVSFYSPLYVGITGLILVVWVVFAAPGRHVIFWTGAAIVTFFLSLGGNTFLYSPLYLFAPGLSVFRGQERWAFATAFSLSVLAAYGFTHLLYLNRQIGREPARVSRLRQSRRWLSRLTWYLLLFALLLDLLFFVGLNDTGWSVDSPFYGLLGASILLTLLLTLTWLLWKFSPGLKPALFTALVAALICFDLFSVNWQTNLYPQLPEWHTQQPPAVQAIKADAVQFAEEPFRVYNEFRLYDNYGVPFEIEDLWGASPLRPELYDHFLAPPMPVERVWELLNVRYVVTWREELFVPSSIIYQEPAADGTTFVHRLENVGPRAWLAPEAELVDDTTQLNRIADPGFDRWQTVLLEPNAAPLVRQFDSQVAEPVADGAAEVTILTNDGGRITYKVDTPNPAFLIISEPYYPGWLATIDGQPAPLLRADFALRAVPVAAGQHTVDLTFRPLSFFIGAIISVVTVGLLGFLFVWWRWK